MVIELRYLRDEIDHFVAVSVVVICCRLPPSPILPAYFVTGYWFSLFCTNKIIILLFFILLNIAFCIVL